MFGWFKSQPVLADDWRDWIDWRFDWLRHELGDRLLRQKTILPSTGIIPAGYAGNCDGAEKTFSNVCSLMGIERHRVELKFYHRQSYATVVRRGGADAAGIYERNNAGQNVIWIEESQLDEPIGLISTSAHELGHVLLLTDRHELSDEPDHEHLTDLLCVFAGFGLFLANSARQDRSWVSGSLQFSSTSWLGYMTMPAIAYALARRANLLNEDITSWTKLLRADLRSDLKQEFAAHQSGQRTPWSGQSGEKPDACSRLQFVPAHVSMTTKAPKPGVMIDDEQPSERNSTAELDVDLQNAGDDSESDEATDLIGVSADDESDADSDDLIATEEGNVEADELFTLGIEFIAEENYLAAIDAFSKALQITPDDTELFRERSIAFLKTGYLQEAIADLTRRLNEFPDDVAALRSRAAVFLEVGRCPEAIDDLSRIRRFDKDARDYLTFGLIYARMGDLQRAVSELTRSITMDPFLSDSYVARSRVYEVLGEPQLAKADFVEAIRRNPDYEDENVRQSIAAARIPIRN